MDFESKRFLKIKPATVWCFAKLALLKVKPITEQNMKTNMTYTTKEQAERLGTAEAAKLTRRGYPTTLIAVRPVEVVEIPDSDISRLLLIAVATEMITRGHNDKVIDPAL